MRRYLVRMYVCMYGDRGQRLARCSALNLLLDLRAMEATSVSGGQNRPVNYCTTTRARNNIARQVIDPASVRSNHICIICKDLTAGPARFRNRNNEIARAYSDQSPSRAPRAATRGAAARAACVSTWLGEC